MARGTARGLTISSWWSKRLYALASDLDEGGRFHRGKKYASDGHVLDIVTSPGLLVAQVRGTQPLPFTVRVRVRVIDTQFVQSQLSRAVGSRDLFSEIASGSLPEEVAEFIIPESAGDIVASCTCPDTAYDCKHVIAVLIQFAADCNTRPELLTKWLGLDLAALVGINSRGASPTAPTYDGDFFGNSLALRRMSEKSFRPAFRQLDPKALQRAVQMTSPEDDVAVTMKELARMYDALREIPRD